MRANPPYLGFDEICRRFEIIISATERILVAAQTIIPGTERSLSATEGILAVASIIICRMEKTVSLTDFVRDARGIMSAKPSRIAGETEIIIGEASLNPSGLEMIETIAGFIDGVLCAVAPLGSRLAYFARRVPCLTGYSIVPVIQRFQVKECSANCR